MPESSASEKPSLPFPLQVERLRRTELRRLAQEALQVQDACNLSGVLHGAYRAACSLRVCGTPDGLGTLETNHHPIMLLWASKIADLAGLPGREWPREAEKQVLSILAMHIPSIDVVNP